MGGNEALDFSSTLFACRLENNEIPINRERSPVNSSLVPLRDTPGIPPSSCYPGERPLRFAANCPPLITTRSTIPAPSASRQPPMRITKLTRLSAGLFAGLLLATGALSAQRDAVVEEVIHLGRTENRVMDHLTYLSEEIGHRLTGSTNIERSERWAVAQFQAFGLEARLERWGEFPVGFDRHEQTGAMVRPHRKELVFGTPSWTPGTPGPVRALAVLEPEDPELLTEMTEELAGAWFVRRSRKRADSGLSQRARELIADVEIAGEIADGGEPILTFGRHRIKPDNLPTDVRIRLRSDQHKELVMRLSNEEHVELEFDIDNRFLTGPVPQFNVIADLVGSEFPNEYVIVGGHHDTWDGSDGAQDNGTGMATTMEAARLLVKAGAQPRRTIRFMFWSGEEQGLLGSRAYVEAHPELMENISAVLVHDGGTNVLSGLAGPPALTEDLRFATAPLKGLHSDFPFRIAENLGLRRSGASDHSSFVAAGVPGFFWRQGGARDDANYDWVHHTQYDTMDQARPEHLRHSAIVVAVTAYNLAMLDNKLSREGLIAPSARKLGVFLDGTSITRVVREGKAAEAGWKAGDVLLKIDGRKVTSQREIVRFLQQADSQVNVLIQREEEQIETALDYTGDADEAQRMKALRKSRKEKAVEKAPEEAQPATTE